MTSLAWISGLNSSRKQWSLRTALTLALAFLSAGCAAGTSSLASGDYGSKWVELSGRQRSESTSYAALLRVKLRHEGRIDDFRAEIFAVGDSLLSVYVRGFLGQSAFKAILAKDSLQVYFPSERKYFVGLRSELETGELQGTDHIVTYLLSLLHGKVSLADSLRWINDIRLKSKHVRIVSDDRDGRCRIELECGVNREEFPYQKTESLNLRSTSGKLQINVQVQSSHYNREIPAEKFSIDLPPGAVRVDKDGLVELLTGVAP